MKKTILFVLILTLNMQLAFAENDATYLSEGKVATVIKDSNNREDIGCSVVLHQTNYVSGNPQFLCYIFNQAGEKICTIR